MGSVGRTFWVEDTDTVDELDLVQCQYESLSWVGLLLGYLGCLLPLDFLKDTCCLTYT